MSIVDKIKAHLSYERLNEDDEPFGTTLLPGLSAAEIAHVEELIKCRVSDEVRELLNYCGGFHEGPMEIVKFTGSDVDGVHPKLNERLRQLSPDGFGNFWCFWSTSVTAGLGPIYYYQHEGPMLFYQSASLIDFVEEYLRFMTPPYASLIDDVHEFRIKPIKELDRDLKSHAVAVSAGDEVLRSLAVSLPADLLFYDFRAAKIGDGIDFKGLEIVDIHLVDPILVVKRTRGWLEKIISIGK